jgi:hypothetical protein
MGGHNTHTFNLAQGNGQGIAGSHHKLRWQDYDFREKNPLKVTRTLQIESLSSFLCTWICCEARFGKHLTPGVNVI